MCNQDKYNASGCLDLTAYEALHNIEREERRLSDELKSLYPFKPLVLICSPYAGDITGNTERAKRYARFAVERGAIPVVPHLMYPRFLDENNPEERKLGLQMGLALLIRCTELWRFGELVSTGMAAEIRKAESRGMTIRWFDSRCREVDP